MRMQKQQFEIAVLRNLIQRLPLGPMLEFGALKRVKRLLQAGL